MSERMPEYRRDLVRELRQRQTESEQILWEQLRAGHLDGLKFRRQRPLGRYVADFCCDAIKLVVEIDGSVHDTLEQREYDAVRDAMLTMYGFTVVHLGVAEVMEALPKALSKIQQAALSLQSASGDKPCPS